MKHQFHWAMDTKIRPQKSENSKSFDLAGQNKVLKDPGQVYIANTINIGQFVYRTLKFLVDF